MQMLQSGKRKLNNNITFVICIHSPDSSIIVCGTTSITELNKERHTDESYKARNNNNISEDDDKPKSSILYFFDLKGTQTSPCMQIGVTGSTSVIYLTWVLSTNQIFCRYVNVSIILFRT